MNRRGFTLIELLAILVILAIIMVLIFPSIEKMINGTDKKKIDSYLRLMSEYAEVNSLCVGCTITLDDLNLKGNKALNDIKNDGYDGYVEHIDNNYIAYLEKGSFCYSNNPTNSECNNISYYAFGKPTQASTTDYSTLGRSVFLKLKMGKYELCIIKDGNLECFKNDYASSSSRLKNVFGAENCYYNAVDHHFMCDYSQWECTIEETNWIGCVNYSVNESCNINSNATIVGCDLH